MPTHSAHLIINEAHRSASKHSETHRQHSHPILRYIHATDTFLHVPAPAPCTATKGHQQMSRPTRSPTACATNASRGDTDEGRDTPRTETADRDRASRRRASPTARRLKHNRRNHSQQRRARSTPHNQCRTATATATSPQLRLSAPRRVPRSPPARNLLPPPRPSPGYRLCGTRPPAARSAPFSDPRRPAQPQPQQHNTAHGPPAHPPAENRQRPPAQPAPPAGAVRHPPVAV